jgi:hypothetical protein
MALLFLSVQPVVIALVALVALTLLCARPP